MDNPKHDSAKNESNPKPKISLLSRRQAAQHLFQNDKRIVLSSTASEDFNDVLITNNPDRDRAMVVDFDGINSQSIDDDPDNGVHEEDQPTNESKMNVSKEELMFLLSVLKSELQSKEVALAAIKYEQLKRLMNPVEISRSSLASAYIQLQDRLKAQSKSDNKNKTNNKLPVGKESLKLDEEPSESSLNQDPGGSENEKSNQESLNILNALLELLDRHPLLALPRDSIYCLDYNCNELSTKNYLNLKIQHLDNLINQHRHYRYLMNERLRKSEQRCMNLALELENERNSKSDPVTGIMKRGERDVLLRQIERLSSELDKERTNKQLVVMTLVTDLKEARGRYQSLAKENFQTNNDEKLLNLQTELEKRTLQLAVKEDEFSREKRDLLKKIHWLEFENSMLKEQLEGQDKSKSNEKQEKLDQLSAQNPPARSNAATNHPVTKPQVPAKPAQLLDQKRNSTSK